MVCSDHADMTGRLLADDHASMVCSDHASDVFGFLMLPKGERIRIEFI